MGQEATTPVGDQMADNPPMLWTAPRLVVSVILFHVLLARRVARQRTWSVMDNGTAMPSHRLILEKARSAGEWLLEWDANRLTLHLPDGNPAFEVYSRKVHYIIDLHELDFESKVCFNTPAGELKFKRNKDALRDMRALVLQAMKADPGFQERYERLARIGIPLGIAAFFVCGGLFGLYCWWASRAPDPPAGNWLYHVGWLIHLILLVLLAGAIGGPIKAYYIWRRVRQLRRATPA